MSEYVCLTGDCLEVMKQIGDSQIDSIVTDAPYGLGFMNKKWDLLPPGIPWAQECLRVLKPGGHLLAFGGTRMYHHLAMAIELGGFEIRDSLTWIQGQGFPKSHDVSKGIDKAAGATREVIGTKRGVGGDNLNDIVRGVAVRQTTDEGGKGVGAYGTGAKQVPVDVPITAPSTDEAKKWEGWGTALKPSVELIAMARKPLIGTVVKNVLEYGTGALNIDATRIGDEVIPINTLEQWSGFGQVKRPDYQQRLSQGRWPANLCLDEEAAALLDAQSGTLTSGDGAKTAGYDASPVFGDGDPNYVSPNRSYADSGGASRFFYVAKASKAERTAGTEGNQHPTVKPIKLMQWLVKLVTPLDGLILDPFMGSGTTGIAAVLEGFNFVGIDQDPEYVTLAQARIEHWKGQNE